MKAKIGMVDMVWCLMYLRVERGEGVEVEVRRGMVNEGRETTIETENGTETGIRTGGGGVEAGTARAVGDVEKSYLFMDCQYKYERLR